jgi:hypothetical protein
MLYSEIIAVFSSDLHKTQIHCVGRTYRTVNTLRLGNKKTNQLRLYSEIIAVCSQIHTKHTNTLWAERTAQ